jgi:predicted metalloprotease
VTVALLAASCASTVDGTGTRGLAANANLAVYGGTDSTFDTVAKNALSDVTEFWRLNFPKVSGGKALPALKGGLYSVDGDSVVATGHLTGKAATEGCLKDSPNDIVDNAFFCEVDDSIVWDRSPDHLLGAIGRETGAAGPLIVAMAFAHEFGHAIQHRLGIFDQHLPTIDTESQADCAAGAWTATVLKNQAAHFSATPALLDQALNAYLLVRDQTPNSSADISHGDGFDRLSALNDGISKGVTFCYSPNYFNRQFTERPFTSDADYASGGNEPLSAVLDATVPSKTNPNAGGLQPDLNRFWTAAAKSINKTFQPVKIAEASSPKCGAAAGSQFGYCPDDNTVYYSTQFAHDAYYSLQSLDIAKDGTVHVVNGQAADYALGTLFAMGWGMAVRHQLFNRSTDDQAALLAAACYVGAYSKDINVANSNGFTLSPPDMDEATASMINLVGQDKAFGARGTTSLERVQAFVKGYNSGLSSC